jgi:hypothetical protein
MYRGLGSDTDRAVASVDWHLGHPVKLINSDQHQQRGRQADERVSTKTGRTAMKWPLEADHGPDKKRTG